MSYDLDKHIVDHELLGVLTAGATGIVTGVGTSNQLAKWTSASAIGDSLISDDGLNITVQGNVFPSGAIDLGAAGAPFNVLHVQEIGSSSLSDFFLRTFNFSLAEVDRISVETAVDDAAMALTQTYLSLGLLSTGASSELRVVAPASSGRYTAFKAQAQAATITYTLPATDAAGSLVSDGAGALSWSTAAYQPLDTDLTEIAAVANVRGDLLLTDNGPAWRRLAVGAANTVLASDGTDVAWSNTLSPTMSGLWTFTNAAGINLSTVGIIQAAVANSGSNVACTIRNSVQFTGSRPFFEVDWLNGSAVYQPALTLFSATASNKELRLLYDASNYYFARVQSNGSATVGAVGTSASLSFTAGNAIAFTASGSSISFSPATQINMNGISIVMNDGMVISNSANVTGLKIGAAADKLGAYSVAPVIQPVGALQAAITNSTGGTQDGTLVDVTTAALADPAKINDNFTDIYALLNAMRTALVATGWMKGAA